MVYEEERIAFYKNLLQPSKSTIAIEETKDRRNTVHYVFNYGFTGYTEFNFSYETWGFTLFRNHKRKRVMYDNDWPQKYQYVSRQEALDAMMERIKRIVLSKRIRGCYGKRNASIVIKSETTEPVQFLGKTVGSFALPFPMSPRV